jgi:hypothetical protein
MAVRHTARRRPPFQPIDLAVWTDARLILRLTLYGVPNEVQKDPLQQWDIASSHTPAIPILNSEANVPFQSNPSHQGREQSD